MSIRVLNATYEVLPTLPQRLVEVEHRHRPSHGNAALVCMVLADKFQDRRGYVDETVPQIAEVTGLAEGTVRSVLAALHKLGLWVKQGKGNQHGGTRRVPAFMAEHRVPSTRSGEEGASRARHAEQDREHRVLDAEHRVLVQGASRAAARDTPSNPHSSPLVLTSTDGSREDADTSEDADATKRARRLAARVRAEASRVHGKVQGDKLAGEAAAKLPRLLARFGAAPDDVLLGHLLGQPSNLRFYETPQEVTA